MLRICLWILSAFAVLACCCCFRFCFYSGGSGREDLFDLITSRIPALASSSTGMEALELFFYDVGILTQRHIYREKNSWFLTPN